MIDNHHSRPGVSLGLLLLLSAAACWEEAGFERTEVSERHLPCIRDPNRHHWKTETGAFTCKPGTGLKFN